MLVYYLKLNVNDGGLISNLITNPVLTLLKSLKLFYFTVNGVK